MRPSAGAVLAAEARPRTSSRPAPQVPPPCAAAPSPGGLHRGEPRQRPVGLAPVPPPRRQRHGEYVMALTLTAIVAGLSDLGLTSLGVRELSVRPPRSAAALPATCSAADHADRDRRRRVTAIAAAVYSATLAAGVALACVGLLLQADPGQPRPDPRDRPAARVDRGARILPPDPHDPRHHLAGRDRGLPGPVPRRLDSGRARRARPQLRPRAGGAVAVATFSLRRWRRVHPGDAALRAGRRRLGPLLPRLDPARLGPLRQAPAGLLQRVVPGHRGARRQSRRCSSARRYRSSRAPRGTITTGSGTHSDASPRPR